jgi:hypothetical protein
MEYYTYAYLRENGTPYYIGKGKNNRAYSKTHNINRPPKNRIIFLKQNLTEEDAFKHEIYMIAVFGRKDLGTGILHNRTNGGEGASGTIPSKEARKNMSIAQKNRPPRPPITEETRRNIITAQNNRPPRPPHTEETKRKMSNSHKGKQRTEEHQRKINEALKCIKRTPHTEETKRKMSESAKRRWNVKK